MCYNANHSFVPHPNPVTKFIAHGTACSMLRMHYAPAQLTTPSSLSPPASHMCGLNDSPRQKLGTLLLRLRPRRVRSSTMCRLQKPASAKIDAQITRKYIRVSDFLSSKRPRNGTHAEKYFACLYLISQHARYAASCAHLLNQLLRLQRARADG